MYRRNQRLGDLQHRPWCLHPCLCAFVLILLQTSHSWRRNKNEFTLCISAAVLWFSQHPVHVSLHITHVVSLIWVVLQQSSCSCALFLHVKQPFSTRRILRASKSQTLSPAYSALLPFQFIFTLEVLLKLHVQRLKAGSAVT